jgi:hypothetical protein
MFQAPAVIIPRVFPNFTEDRIRYVFNSPDVDIGVIGRIDMEPLISSQGENYNRVRIYFSSWNTTTRAQTARNKLLNGKDVKIVYDFPWFWKVSAIQNPGRHMIRAPIIRPHIDFGDEEEGENKCKTPSAAPLPIAPTLAPQPNSKSKSHSNPLLLRRSRSPPPPRPRPRSPPPPSLARNNHHSKSSWVPLTRPLISALVSKRPSPRPRSPSTSPPPHPTGRARSPSTSPPRERGRGRGRGEEGQEEEEDKGEIPEYNEFSIDYEKIGVIYPKKRRPASKKKVSLATTATTATAIVDSENMTEAKKDMCDALYSDIHG